MQAPPAHPMLNALTGRLVGPVSVVFAVFAQSTWNFHTFRLFVPNSRREFGSPAGGSVLPSTSDTSSPPCVVPVLKHCCVAAWPASIFAESHAHTQPPAKVFPLNML